MNTALLFFFFLSAIIAATLASPTANDLVRDVDGKFVLTAAPYFLLPVLKGRGGGLQLAQTGNETCPLTVVQSPYGFFPGFPIVLSHPQSYFRSTITTNIPASIGFLGVCAPVSLWQVVNEPSTIGRSVKMGGDIDSYSFTVSKHPKGYKLVYWPKLDAKYEDLGITVDDRGNKRLVVANGETFVFKFKSAESGRYHGIRSTV